MLANWKRALALSVAPPLAITLRVMANRALLCPRTGAPPRTITIKVEKVKILSFILFWTDCDEFESRRAIGHSRKGAGA